MDDGNRCVLQNGGKKDLLEIKEAIITMQVEFKNFNKNFELHHKENGNAHGSFYARTEKLRNDITKIETDQGNHEKNHNNNKSNIALVFSGISAMFILVRMFIMGKH